MSIRGIRKKNDNRQINRKLYLPRFCFNVFYRVLPISFNCRVNVNIHQIKREEKLIL